MQMDSESIEPESSEYEEWAIGIEQVCMRKGAYGQIAPAAETVGWCVHHLSSSALVYEIGYFSNSSSHTFANLWFELMLYGLAAVEKTGKLVWWNIGFQKDDGYKFIVDTQAQLARKPQERAGAGPRYLPWRVKMFEGREAVWETTSR